MILRAALVVLSAVMVAQGQSPASPPPGAATVQPDGRGGAQRGGGGGQGRGPNSPQQQRNLADLLIGAGDMLAAYALYGS